jgi:hypothetical protein
MRGNRMPGLDSADAAWWLVERVAGRPARRRAIGPWPLTGLGAGLLYGLLLGWYAFEHSFLAVAGTSIALGLWWGVVFGYTEYACARGRNDSDSVYLLVAIDCDLMAREDTER